MELLQIRHPDSGMCLDARFQAQGSEIAMAECKEKGGADQVGAWFGTKPMRVWH